MFDVMPVGHLLVLRVVPFQPDAGLPFESGTLHDCVKSHGGEFVRPSVHAVCLVVTMRDDDHQLTLPRSQLTLTCGW